MIMLISGVVALVLLVVAAATPVMGYAAAENYESRKFYGIFEGDWFFLFALIAGVACIACAWIVVARGVRVSKQPNHSRRRAVND